MLAYLLTILPSSSKIDCSQCVYTVVPLKSSAPVKALFFLSARDSHFFGFQRHTEIGPSSLGAPFLSLSLLLPPAEEMSPVVLQRSLPLTKNITTSMLLPGIPLSSLTLFVHKQTNLQLL